ncbi:hypothetical protein V6N12_068448 [Hibiscus sabdariffa]|uniref:Uncharacterized protein n=1 Tax=Hibiscus sabdariffa TaxID=183260 RepID=A0ABR2FQ05_9ROSI
MERNPNISISLLQHKNPGGRPPEFVVEMDRTLDVERFASPTPIDGVCMVKKGRNDAPGVHDSVVVDMDSDHGGNIGKHPAVQDPSRGKSYADVTAARGSVAEGKRSTGAYVDDEVVILSEDVIMDSSSPIPLICFSDRVHDQVKPGATSGTSNGSRFEVLQEQDGHSVSMSGFVSLDLAHAKSVQMVAGTLRPSEGEGRVVTSNDSYLLSNPSKNLKVAKTVGHAAKVVPTVDGKTATLTTNATGTHKGHHDAVTIVEKGFEKVTEVLEKAQRPIMR